MGKRTPTKVTQRGVILGAVLVVSTLVVVMFTVCVSEEISFDVENSKVHALSVDEVTETLDQAESLYEGFLSLYKEEASSKENDLALSMLHRSRMMVYSLIAPYQFSTEFLIEGDYFPLPVEGEDYSRLFDKWRSSVNTLLYSHNEGYN